MIKSFKRFYFNNQTVRGMFLSAMMFVFSPLSLAEEGKWEKHKGESREVVGDFLGKRELARQISSPVFVEVRVKPNVSWNPLKANKEAPDGCLGAVVSPRDVAIHGDCFDRLRKYGASIELIQKEAGERPVTRELVSRLRHSGVHDGSALPIASLNVVLLRLADTEEGFSSSIKPLYKDLLPYGKDPETLSAHLGEVGGQDFINFERRRYGNSISQMLTVVNLSTNEEFLYGFASTGMDSVIGKVHFLFHVINKSKGFPNGPVHIRNSDQYRVNEEGLKKQNRQTPYQTGLVWQSSESQKGNQLVRLRYTDTATEQWLPCRFWRYGAAGEKKEIVYGFLKQDLTAVAQRKAVSIGCVGYPGGSILTEPVEFETLHYPANYQSLDSSRYKTEWVHNAEGSIPSFQTRSSYALQVKGGKWLGLCMDDDGLPGYTRKTLESYACHTEAGDVNSYSYLAAAHVFRESMLQTGEQQGPSLYVSGGLALLSLVLGVVLLYQL